MEFVFGILALFLIVLFGVLFFLLFLSFIIDFIGKSLLDSLHYKYFGTLLFDPNAFFADPYHLTMEYEKIKAGKKAWDLKIYRIFFTAFYHSKSLLRYAFRPSIFAAIVLITLFILMFLALS